MNIFDYLNVSGLIFMVLIMIPNIIYAQKKPEGFENLWHNKIIEVFEQIGRIGSFGFMIVTIPYTFIGFSSNIAFWVYIIIDSTLILCYLLVWYFCFKINSVFRALALSIIPSVIFLFSGIMNRSFLLIIFSLIFAPMHILISYKNASLAIKKNNRKGL